MKSLSIKYALIKYFLLMIVFIAPSLWAAGQPLSKDLVRSMYAVTEKMDALEAKYPQVFSASDKFAISDQEKAIAFIKQSKAYPDVQSTLSSAGFKNLDEFYDVSLRLMGGMYFVQMQKMPAGMDMDIMAKSLEANIKKMKEQNMPPGLISSMEESLQKSRERNNEMQFAQAQASDADKKFVAENISWIMSMVPGE